MMDKGPFKVINVNGKTIIGSDDFTHDVWLYLTGDFESDEDRQAYADWVARVLTDAGDSQ